MMFTTDFVTEMLESELAPPVEKQVNIDELSKNMTMKMENLVEQKLKEFEENLTNKVSELKPTEETEVIEKEDEREE